jgi:glycosyltransferase involved in cell wall biosynthesis
MNPAPPTNSLRGSVSRPTIAVFIPSLRGGGVERNMLNLTRGMADAGHPVDLVLVSAQGPFLKMVDKRVRVVDLKSSRVVSALPKLVRYLKDARPAALLSGMGHANIIAVIARGLSGVNCRLVVSEHTLPSVIAKVASTPLSKTVPVLSRWFYPRADAVVAVSEDVGRDLREASGLREELITVIPNPVVTPELMNELARRAEHHFFDEGLPPVILGIGRLSHEKGFDILIRAFGLLLETMDARLLIVGEGADRPKLEALVAELGLENKVDLPGFVDGVPAYICQAAVVVMPSRIEGFGNALVEAMAGGVPCVATDCPGGPSDILEHGKYGPLVPFDDPRALAKGIEKAMRDPVPTDVLISRAAEFSLDRVVARYLEVLGVQPNGH